MSERFHIGFYDGTTKEKILQVKKIFEQGLETILTVNADFTDLYFSCYLIELSNIWQVKIDQFDIPYGLQFYIEYPDSRICEYI